MKNKKKDVLYCGVNKNKIKTANPQLNLDNFSVLKYWIKERYTIHLKKDVYFSKKPWTNDKILQKYKFCNVRREQDRESLWLIDNIINSDLDYSNKLLNIMLFRLFNKSKTFQIFGPIDFFKFNFEKIKKKIEYFCAKNDFVYFSNAFYTSGPKSVANKMFSFEKNMILKIILLVKSYFDNNILEKIKKCLNQLEIYNELVKFPGIGEFLAYQIFVDFSYIPSFPYSENEFVICGPGCRKGIDLIFKNFDGLSYSECLFWLRDNQKVLFGENYCNIFSDLEDFDKKINIMCLENCMCEISKYIRVKKKSGRPRIRYPGI